MSDKEKKEIHKQEQIKHQKPRGIAFDLGDYVSIDRETMTVYNHLCAKYDFNKLYGFVSYDEVSNNSSRDYINIVRFRIKGGYNK
jgi:hypothetical protein